MSLQTGGQKKVATFESSITEYNPEEVEKEEEAKEILLEEKEQQVDTYISPTAVLQRANKLSELLKYYLSLRKLRV